MTRSGVDPGRGWQFAVSVRVWRGAFPSTRGSTSTGSAPDPVQASDVAAPDAEVRAPPKASRDEEQTLRPSLAIPSPLPIFPKAARRFVDLANRNRPRPAPFRGRYLGAARGSGGLSPIRGA